MSSLTLNERDHELFHALLSVNESRTDAPYLELIRDDLGGAADHVVRKCTHDIERHFTLTPFQQLLRTQQFRLVVITGTAPKAAAILKSAGSDTKRDQIHNRHDCR